MDAEQRRLVTENIGLANFLAKMMWERNKENLERDELQSQAYQGLVAAAMRWRTYGIENGYSIESIDSAQYFSVFARKRILGQIMDAMREADHVQRSVRSQHKAILKAGYGQGIDTGQISIITGLNVDRIREVLHSVENKPTSLFGDWGGQELGEETASSPYEHVGATHHVHEATFVNEVTRALVGAFDELEEQQQIIVALRFYQQLELQGIAAELDLGLTVVRETLNTAVLALHAAMFAAASDEIG